MQYLADRWRGAGQDMIDPIGAVGGVISGVIHFFQTIAPGGFGLAAIPILILGVIALLVARKSLPIE